MTMKELADKVGVSEATISRWESGEIANMKRNYIVKLADALGTKPNAIMGWEDHKVERSKAIRIPVLGNIAAGIPIEAVDDIIDWEEITPEVANGSRHFALRIQGDSMAPRIKEGDIIIVRKQETCESGDVCVILINGFDATVKEIHIKNDGIELIAYNPLVYQSTYYTAQEVQKLPITILGKVIELRGKFI